LIAVHLIKLDLFIHFRSADDEARVAPDDKSEGEGECEGHLASPPRVASSLGEVGASSDEDEAEDESTIAVDGDQENSVALRPTGRATRRTSAVSAKQSAVPRSINIIKIN
jgi:hypothetical protein